MGQNQEIEIDVSENMEPGSSSNEENGIKRRGPSPESKLSDTGLFKNLPYMIKVFKKNLLRPPPIIIKSISTL